MKRLLRAAGFALCALLVPTLNVHAAEPLPAELNLIPRDSAMVISINVKELWTNPTLKSLKELAVKEGIFKDFEKQNGFLPENVERVSIMIPTFPIGPNRSDPFGVITFAKPYNLAQLLEAWDGRTDVFDEMGEMPRPHSTRVIEKMPAFKDAIPPKGFSPPPKPFEPPFNKKEFELKNEKFPEPKEFPKFPSKDFDFKKPQSKKELAPLPREHNVVYLSQAKEEAVRAEEEPQPVARSRKRDLTAGHYFLGKGGGLLIPIDERTICITFGGIELRAHGNSFLALTTQLLRRKDDGPLAMALNLAAEKHAAVLGMNLPMLERFVGTERQLKLLPIHSLLAAKGAAMTFDLGEELTVRIHLNCDNAAAAKKAKDLLQAYLTLGKEMLPGIAEEVNRNTDSKAIAKVFGLSEKSLDDATLDVKDTRVEMTIKMQADAVLLAAVTEAVQKIREASERAKAQNNLKQLALGVHMFNDAMGMMPFPGMGSADGPVFGGNVIPKPNLSWRVALLPYIEQQNLYHQFHFNEPWDSEHNKKLIPLMPKTYEIPGTNAPKGQTYYRAFNVLNNIGSIVQITDGTSNTIMIVEAGESVPWTKPDDFPAISEKKLPKLGGHFRGGFNAAMCDGSVRFIKDTISKLTLYNAITPNGGEVLGSDWK